MTMLGLRLAIDNARSVSLIVIGFGLAFLPRIRIEEHILESELGERYRAFAATRKRLLPGIW